MKNLVILLVMVLVTSCAPIYVNYDYEKGTDFTKYKTYNYYSDLETGLSALDSKRLLNNLDANLRAKGITLSETPDFFINIQSQEFMNNQRSNVGIGVGGSGRHVGGGVSVGIPVGQSNVNREIIIDFIDENAKGLFWQAVSESSFDPNAIPEKREARLKAIVDKILLKYPPKK
jgi:hypothetical protein